MGKSASWLIVIAAIGSVVAAVATLLHYIQSHHAGQPGGYLALTLGAITVGVLVAGCSYFANPETARSVPTSGLQGGLALLAFLVIVFVTLIWGFGT